MEKNRKAQMLSKDEFVDIINRLQEANKLADAVEELFRNSRENIENDYCNAASLQVSHEGIVIKLLEKIMEDKKHTIKHFIYELDYGQRCKEDVSLFLPYDVELTTVESLYDYLTSNNLGE